MDLSLITREEVSKKLNSGDFITYKNETKNQNTREGIWCKFSKIKSGNGDYIPLVSCNQCKVLCRFLKNASVGNLKGHSFLKRSADTESQGHIR